ncbi:MAG TPA: NAD-dependent epimerase/dehydratase family protein, partial [Rhodopila sp.]
MDKPSAAFGRYRLASPTETSYLPGEHDIEADRIMSRSALIAGVSGIVGNNLARHLLQKGWQVSGLARRPPSDIDGLQPVAADLLDPAGLTTALQAVRPSHVFITTWLRQPTEAENIRINTAMVRNLLDAVRPAGSVG